MKHSEKDELLIRQLIEAWAKAVRNKDLAAILANHSEDMVIYDVPAPFESVGIEAYRKTWDTFYTWAQDLGVFDIQELHVTAGSDVAFCFAAMKCAGRNKSGATELLDFRLTIGLKKINNAWTIIHEHHSLPSS